LSELLKLVKSYFFDISTESFSERLIV